MSKTLVTERYSRILVPLPPVQSIKDEVKKLVEDTFKTTPEYVETNWCEGYAISWRSWYGFEDNMRYPAMRSFFPLRLKRIIDDWLDDEENMQVIESVTHDWNDIIKISCRGHVNASILISLSEISMCHEMIERDELRYV